MVDGMSEAKAATILVIDDDAEIRYSLTRVLSSRGYQIIEAPSGEQGIALAKRIMGAGQYTEARDPGDPGDPDVIVLRATGARVETGNEEIRVRVRNGVVEIVHSDGV